MSLTLKDLRSSAAVLPPRLLIYGPPGLGKTTLAAEFPDPVVIDVENGLPPGLQVPNFADLPSYDAVMEAIQALYIEDHDRKTAIVDTLDRLEPLIWAKVCEVNNWASIETPGYGKGYVETDKYWRDFLDGMNALRRDKGMTVILTAHSTVERFDDPTRASYSRFDIRLHKRALQMVQDEVDAILFVNQDATLKQNDPKAKQGPGARVHAEGGGTRWVYCEGRPAFTAKNRYDLPERFIFKKGEGYAALAAGLPGLQAPAEDKQPAKAAATRKAA